MKIERYFISPPCSLEQFADQHELVLEIHERDIQTRECKLQPPLERFYTSFNNVDIKDGACLVSVFGNGETEDEAILDFCAQIQGKQLIKDAGYTTREVLQAPDKVTWKGGVS